MLRILVVALQIVHIFTASCNKEFNFSENSGNGFFITCDGISEPYIHLLTDNKLQNEVQLTIVNSIFKKATSSLFNNFQPIKELQIKNTTFRFEANEPVFKRLERLEVLKIEKAEIQINDHTLEGLAELRFLSLVGNNLTEISESAFENTPSLQTLKISENNVTNVGHIGLCFLKNLKTLDLSRNQINHVNSRSFLCVREVSENLGFDLNGDHISVNGKQNEYLDTRMKSKIDSIDLSFNEIVHLNDVFQAQVNLKRVSLEGNKLESVKNGDFSALTELRTLTLKSNDISVIEALVFRDKKELLSLNLENNVLNTVYLKEATALTNLNLASNRFDCRGLMNIGNLVSLKILNLSHNSLADGCIESFSQFTNVQELNLSGNPLKLENQLFKGFTNLTKLSLSKNGHISVPSVIFRDLINMQYLDLSENQIQSLDGETFTTNVRLQTLNISNNLLQNFHFALIKSLKNLQVLDISGNQLHAIEYETTFTKLPSLSIDIKSNLFTCDYLFKMQGFFRNRSITYTITENEGNYCQDGKVANFPQVSEQSGISFGAILLICFAVATAIGGGVYLKKRYIFTRRSAPSDFELLQ